MGHLVGKDLYRKLGKKIDGQHVRTPWNEAFGELLKEIFSAEEAELIIKMPFFLSDIDRIGKTTKFPRVKLEALLGKLCRKGLVMDFFVGGETRYMPSPFMVGIFEFTMMRSAQLPEKKKRAKLLGAYLEEGSYFRENFPPDSQVSIARTVPHQEAVADHVEILDYESVERIIDSNEKFAVGICSCRHKREHAGGVSCGKPQDTCTTFGHAADYLIRNDMAREISRTEMHEICAKSKELGLAFSVDNVQQKQMFVCHCCGCCCSLFLGISEHGMRNTLVTSSYIAEVAKERCIGCNKCVTECPAKAISMVAREKEGSEREKRLAKIDASFCVGCGVCTLKCPGKALQLVGREKRVIHPATTFERVILQCLERGTLQNQIFDNPESMTQEIMRGLVGGFLRLSPVKKALMSDLLRSTFLKAMEAGVDGLDRGFIHEL